MSVTSKSLNSSAKRDFCCSMRPANQRPVMSQLPSTFNAHLKTLKTTAVMRDGRKHRPSLFRKLPYQYTSLETSGWVVVGLSTPGLHAGTRPDSLGDGTLRHPFAGKCVEVATEGKLRSKWSSSNIAHGYAVLFLFLLHHEILNGNTSNYVCIYDPWIRGRRPVSTKKKGRTT